MRHLLCAKPSGRQTIVLLVEKNNRRGWKCSGVRHVSSWKVERASTRRLGVQVRQNGTPCLLAVQTLSASLKPRKTQQASL
eukprot:14087627-Heterocapsa_arctica.AAC.1